MPWKIMNIMDQKMQLIADWKNNLLSITDLSQKYGISRPTVYKWIRRYEEQSVEGLKDQSRKPLTSPNQTENRIISLILQEKLKNRKRGPKKILYQLKRQYPDISWPAASTIGEWLKKGGLVKPRKRRLRVPPYTEPFQDCQSPNATWSADYKGQFHTGDNNLCYPLTISDNYSRYLLKCQGLPGPRYHETRNVFESTFKQYGLPEVIRTDNGVPFAGKSVGGLSRLMIWWIQLGIQPERIKKGAPQENGRHERMHRTLKDEALDPISHTIKEQQECFDWFQWDYNNDRPHEALDQKTPKDYYSRSSREYRDNPPKPNYDYKFEVRQVRHSGEIRFKGSLYFLSSLLKNQPVGLTQVTEDQWDVYYSFYRLAALDMRKNKIIK